MTKEQLALTVFGIGCYVFMRRIEFAIFKYLIKSRGKTDE